MQNKTMRNQQERLLSWLGGLIDGEGCFYACYSLLKSESKHVIRVGFSIGMNSQETIDRVKLIFDDLGITNNALNHPVKNGRQAYVVRISGLTQLDKFLPIIIPYLFTKQPQALLMQKYVNARKYRPSRNFPYRRSDIDLIENIRLINTPRRRILRDFTPRLGIIENTEIR